MEVVEIPYANMARGVSRGPKPESWETSMFKG